MPTAFYQLKADLEAIESLRDLLARHAKPESIHLLPSSPTDSPPLIIQYQLREGEETAFAQGLWHLRAFGLAAIEDPAPIKLATTPDEVDWPVAGWRLRFTSVSDTQPAANRLLIHPGSAFGSGLHPTTTLLLRAIRELHPIPAHALDVGCGSGILSLAALKHGIADVTGIDIDPAAPAESAQNARLNALPDKRWHFSSTPLAKLEASYDLVLANIVPSALHPLLPDLAKRLTTNGCLLISGLQAFQLATMESALSALGLEKKAEIRDNDWIALRYQNQYPNGVPVRGHEVQVARRHPTEPRPDHRG